MGKLKYSLISLLAVCLTAGGVFAAWQFTDGTIENPDPVGVDVSTEGLGGMEFMQVNVKFDANGGQFPDGTTEKSVTSKKYQAITADAYTFLFKTYADFPTKQVDGQTWYFSNWSVNPGNDTTDYFSFDNGFTEDDTLYAVYVPSTNPAIYRNYDDVSIEDELLGYLRVNSGSEYYMRNFIATGMKNHSKNTRGFHYVIKQGNSEYKILASRSLDKSTYGFQINQGTDYLVNGLYNIYFDPTKTPNEGTTSGDLGWFVYGGKAFFEPQYNYRLVGNPVAKGNDGWADPSPNPVTFRYVSTSADGKTKNYVIDRVDFPFWEGEATREFKPYIANFGFYPLRDWDYQNSDKLYPKMYHASDTTTKAHLGYSGDSKGANLKILNSSVLAYKVTMSVTYEDRKPFDVSYDNGVNETYISFNNYPVSMTVGLEPYEHKINIYENTNAAEPSEVKYALSNAVWSERTNYPDKTHDLISKKYNGIGWKDYYTDKEIDFSTLNINKSYHIYPVYNEIEATKKNLTLTVISAGKTKNVVIPMYEGHTVKANVDYYLNDSNVNEYDNDISIYLDENYIQTVTGIGDSNISSCKYSFDDYVNGNNLNSKTTYTVKDILDSEINSDITYTARYKSDIEVLRYYNTSSYNTYKYVYKSTSSDITVYGKLNSSKREGIFKSYYLYNYGFDPLSTISKTYNILTESGIFKVDYSTDYSILRYIKMDMTNSATWWDDSSAVMYARSWDASDNEAWTLPSSKTSNNNAVYHIPYDHHRIIFVRKSKEGANWNDVWNQTVNVHIGYYNASYTTFKLYGGDSRPNNKLQVYFTRSSGDYWWNSDGDNNYTF